MRRDVWTTYRTTGYTHQVGTDPRATGGVHFHQVRKTSTGWQKRIIESNGRYESTSPIQQLDAAEGERYFALARR